MMQQYYILTLHPRAPEVWEFITQHKLNVDVHLNRTRFWVPEGSVFTEFALRFMDCCPPVLETPDHYALGGHHD
jgi:hypothetical protein